MLLNHFPQGAILVLNERFLPTSSEGPFCYGVVNYALATATALKDKFRGFLLYRRNETLQAPIIRNGDFLGFPTQVVEFHFGMNQDCVARAIERASQILGDEKTILYYQTNTLLTFHPKTRQAFVTHHAPFVEHVKEHLGEEGVTAAFGHSAEKVRQLYQWQRKGLERLLFDSQVFALEFSEMQKRLLSGYGVADSRIHSISPPFFVAHSEKPGEQAAVTFRNLHSEIPFIISAAARNDYFKQLDLVIDAAVDLLNSGFLVATAVLAGESLEELEVLKTKIPQKWQSYFHFESRQNRTSLLTIFRSVRNAVFICSSRYETFGFTPFEAHQCQLPVLVANRPETVEFTRFVEPKNRFIPKTKSLALKIQEFMV